MRRSPATIWVCIGLFVAVGTAVSAEEDAPGALPPYKMVRTLQTIQDSVIAGDVDSVEMQRFLLGEIDKRLRDAKPEIFDDPRNVDAALIYAMSGGNPKTLDLIADRDVDGYFDNRVTSILRRYLAGRGSTAAKQLKEVVPEYRNTRIGPYLALIGANALMEQDPQTALTYFDWARFEAPGSIVEEAALRRSLNMTSKSGDIKRALPYARKYARRYMTSPYASQFTDIFVSLAMDHPTMLPPVEIEAVLSLVERQRQREIYLRLARRAAIAGDKPLADFAANKAKELSKPEDKDQLALAELYANVVNVPSEGINGVLEKLAAIPEKSLSPKDRFLRDAAQVVADEMMREPDKDSLTQESHSTVKQVSATDAGHTSEEKPATAAHDKDPHAATEKAADDHAGANQKALDAAIGDVESFVTAGQDKLKDIDALLSTESN